MKAGSEAVFQQQVEQLAAFYGWDLVFHAPDNLPRQTRSGRVRKQHVTPGFPDLVMVRGPELLFAELKAEKGRLSAAQKAWIAALTVVQRAVEQLARGPYGDGRLEGPPPAVEVHVWRPSDWDALHARLSRGRHQIEPIYRAGAA